MEVGVGVLTTLVNGSCDICPVPISGTYPPCSFLLLVKLQTVETSETVMKATAENSSAPHF